MRLVQAPGRMGWGGRGEAVKRERERTNPTPLSDLLHFSSFSPFANYSLFSFALQLINFWDHFNRTMIDKVPNVGPATAILPAAGWEEEVVKVAGMIDNVTVYRKADIPDRYHYKNNPRIMPVLIIADEGWMLSTVSLFRFILSAHFLLLYFCIVITIIIITTTVVVVIIIIIIIIIMMCLCVASDIVNLLLLLPRVEVGALNEYPSLLSL